MPSVRDILQKLQPTRTPAASQALTPETPATVEAPGPEPEKPDEQKQKPANDLVQRMRVLAEQRTALARLEVERQRDRVDQVKEQMEDLNQKDMQPAELAVQLNSAQIRLDDARANLARAEEAQLNTELSAGMKQSHGKDLGLKAGGKKVGNLLGHKGKPAVLEAPAPGMKAH